MAILLTQPLGCVLAYDPAFKVDVCQNEALHVAGISAHDVLLDVLAVSAQLDLLVKKELAKAENGRIENAKVSRSFETKAMVMMRRIRTALKNLANPQPSPEEYIETSGLAELYPRAATYMSNPGDFSVTPESTQMDGYFAQLGNVHQLVTLAHQINSDVTGLPSHKYIAHQLVLLHQALGLFGEHSALRSLKQNVERNFDGLKAALVPGEQEEQRDVRLPPEHAQWLLDVTSNVVHEATCLSSDVAPKLPFPARVLLTT